MTIFRCSFLVVAPVATSACDTDMYQNTTACRDNDANAVCPIDGSRDEEEPVGFNDTHNGSSK